MHDAITKVMFGHSLCIHFGIVPYGVLYMHLLLGIYLLNSIFLFLTSIIIIVLPK